MALPVIADTFRCVLQWASFGGVTPRNVFHVESTASGNVSDIASAIGAAMSDGMFAAMELDFLCTTIGITPLDGSTAETFHSLGDTFNGSGASGLLPAVAAVVSFQTTRRGPRGRGRMYLGPLGETSCANGLLDTTKAATMATGWGNFLADLNSGTPSLDLVVASYVHADSHPVVSVRIDELVGTQRRRQDQLR